MTSWPGDETRERAGEKVRARERENARKTRRTGNAGERGSREMNHIIMNNNMPCPWCSLCLVINSNDLAGDFARDGGGCVSREARTTTLRDSPRTTARTPTASLSIHAYTVNGTRIHVGTSLALASSVAVSIATITYVDTYVGTLCVIRRREKKKSRVKYFAQSRIAAATVRTVPRPLILIAIEPRM